MSSLISRVAEPQVFLADLNYLNLREIKTFCRKHGIPFAIQLEHHVNTRRKTAGDDRKGIIVDRVRSYLK